MYRKRQLLVFMIAAAFMLALTGCGAAGQKDTKTEEGSVQMTITENVDGEVTGAVAPNETGTESGTAGIEPGSADTEQKATAESGVDGSDTALVTVPEDAAAVGEGTLVFRDVFGESYEMKLNPNALANPYDNSFFHKEGSLTVYDDGQHECLTGIDVSEYQGDVDWQAVKEQGISFVMVRVGFRGYGEEGTLVADENYMENIKGAKEAGLLTGAYFFSQAVNEEEAVEEADYILSLLGDETLDLPVVYDVEHIRNDIARTDDVTGEQFTRNAIAFCERIKAAGRQSMIYANMLWEAFQYDMAELSDYPFWYADYEEVPQTPYLYAFWQYSESGSVEGIDAPVDLNLWIR